MDVPDAFVFCKAKCRHFEYLLAMAKIDADDVVLVDHKRRRALYTTMWRGVTKIIQKSKKIHILQR